MNSNRKADLQRKLSLVSVPKPPADLSARIKADIPKYLTPAVERRRSRTFALRVAASILLVVTSAIVAIQFFSPGELPMSVAMKQSEKAATPPFDTRAVDTPPPAATTAAVDELRVDIEEAPAAAVRREATDSAVITQATSAPAEQRDQAQVGGVTGYAFNETLPAPPPPVAVAEAAPPAAPVPPPAAPAAPAEAVTITASAPQIVAPQRTSLMREAVAADLQTGPRDSVFGISVDPEVFPRLKNELESGQQPQAASVNVDAIANYFASPETRVRRNVQLEVEGSPSPVNTARQRGILRFTVDTETVSIEPGGSVPPIATDARVEINFNSRAVSSFRRLGDDAAVTPEKMLLKNESVTALYEVELNAGISAETRVATVKLHYRSVANGREQTITREIRAHNLSRSWTKASHRHKLASLGAVWAETLKGSGTPNDVAKKAQELATQAPDDSRARDLSKAATASSRLRSSGPTGSGR